MNIEHIIATDKNSLTKLLQEAVFHIQVINGQVGMCICGFRINMKEADFQLPFECMVMLIQAMPWQNNNNSFRDCFSSRLER